MNHQPRKLVLKKTSSRKLAKQVTAQQKQRMVGGYCWSTSGNWCDSDPGPCETAFNSCSC